MGFVVWGAQLSRATPDRRRIFSPGPRGMASAEPRCESCQSEKSARPRRSRRRRRRRRVLRVRAVERCMRANNGQSTCARIRGGCVSEVPWLVAASRIHERIITSVGLYAQRVAARAPSCERVSAITFPRRAFDPLPQHALLGCLGNLIPDPHAFFARVTFTHRFATLFAHNANTSLPILCGILRPSAWRKHCL